ncbi:hypothetical protein [Chloroflexus sp.]|uniref:hypothetical protein n=1 Tax=Chloroflexus sp. TaxID=1904827 RepID=UPI003C711147
MARITSAEFAEKWARRISGAVSDVQAGVARVSESPGSAAARQAKKWVSKITDPKTQQKWARNVGSISLEEWKAQMINVGAGRIPSGAEAARGKVEAFATQLLQHQESGLSKIKSMPDVTIEDSKARMMAWFDHMSKFEFRK